MIVFVLSLGRTWYISYFYAWFGRKRKSVCAENAVKHQSSNQLAVVFSSSSSEQELQFSDDEDGSEEMPDVSWQEFVRRTYYQRFGGQATVPTAPGVSKDRDRQSSDTDTVGGASDADWETESDTEQESGMY